MAKQVAYGEATVRAADGALVSRATGTFLLHRPDARTPPPDPYRVPAPGPGCAGSAVGPRRGAAVCFACRVGRRSRLGLLLAPVLPGSAVPAPGPLYTVLMGYKSRPSPRRGPVRRHGARACVTVSLRSTPGASAPCRGLRCHCVWLSPRPAARRLAPPRCRRACRPSVRRASGGALVRPALLVRAGRAASGTCGPDADGFDVPPSTAARDRGRRVLLLDDTYVSGARAQSAAASAPARPGPLGVIVALGRVLRPDRSPVHPVPALARRAAPAASEGPRVAVLPLRSDRGAERVARRRSAPRTPSRARPRPARVPGATRRAGSRVAARRARAARAGPTYWPERTDERRGGTEHGQRAGRRRLPERRACRPARACGARGWCPSAAPLPARLLRRPARDGRPRRWWAGPSAASRRLSSR